MDSHPLTKEETPINNTKRKHYSAEFKAKVALEEIKGEQTSSESGSLYGLHPNMITNWKRQAIDNIAEAIFQQSRTRPHQCDGRQRALDGQCHA